VLFELLADESPLGRARLQAFLITRGRGRSSTTRTVHAGVPVKPEAASFYAAGATKAEVEAWLTGLRRRSGRGPRVLHHDSPGPRGPLPDRAV